MAQEFLIALSEIRENLKTHGYPNERSIVSCVVKKLLRVLGWDIDNPRKVYEEFPAIPGQEGKKVDLALFVKSNTSRPDVYIEVKRPGLLQNQDEEKKAENQLWDYDKYNRVNLAILTDGQIWHFYYPFATGSYSDRRAYTLDIITRTEEDCERYLDILLSYASLEDGRAVEELKRLHQERAQEAITRAEFSEVWSKLLTEPNEYFLEGIVTAFQQIKGMSPDLNVLKKLLKEILDDKFLEEDIRTTETVLEFSRTTAGEQQVTHIPSGTKALRTRIKVKIDWQADRKSLPIDIICENTAASSLVKVLERLSKVYGPQILQKLSSLQVSRGTLVTKDPNNRYQHKRIYGSDYYVLTHSSTPEKVEILRRVLEHLNLPSSLFNVGVVEN